jgi:hypothetical protein
MTMNPTPTDGLRPTLLSDECALRTRVCILEAALDCVRREADLALGRPDISFLTLCRIASVARQSRKY